MRTYIGQYYYTVTPTMGRFRVDIYSMAGLMESSYSSTPSGATSKAYRYLKMINSR